MKKNHHSLQYKMEANPNKTFKQLKQKQKAKISDWLYKEVFLYYQGHNSFPKSDGFLNEVKRSYTDLINIYVKDDKQKLKVFDRNGVYLPTKKIGKNHPKAEQIKTDNQYRTV